MQLLKRDDNLLIISLLVLSIIIALPVLFAGLNGAFYAIDPDVIYVGNALSFIKTHIIHYRDHPGTPSILLIAFSYWPFRVYAKVMESISFIDWSFLNLDLVLFYTRFIYFAVFISSIAIYLKAIGSISRSKILLILGWVLLFAYSYTPFMATKIAAETVSFFITSLWLYLLSRHIRNKSPLFILHLSFLSGLALAVKYNNFIIAAISVLLPLSFSAVSFVNRIKNVVLAGVIVFGSFIVFTWPLRGVYKHMVASVINISSRSGLGASHGQGESVFFNMTDIMESLQRLTRSETVYILLLCVIVIGTIYLAIKRRGNVGFLVITSVITLLTFVFLAKYPLSYYQLPVYLVMTYLVIYILSEMGSRYLVVAAVITAMIIVPSKLDFYFENALGVLAEPSVEEKLEINKDDLVLWDYGNTQDFTYIWIRDWVGGLYGEQIEKYKPNILELTGDFKTVTLPNGSLSTVKETCWDTLYIRKNRLDDFLEANKDVRVEANLVSGTSLFRVDNLLCE